MVALDASMPGNDVYGETTANHSDTCRKRIADCVRATDEGKRRIEDAELRERSHLAEQVERHDKSASAKG